MRATAATIISAERKLNGGEKKTEHACLCGTQRFAVVKLAG